MKFADVIMSTGLYWHVWICESEVTGFFGFFYFILLQLRHVDWFLCKNYAKQHISD